MALRQDGAQATRHLGEKRVGLDTEFRMAQPTAERTHALPLRASIIAAGRDDAAVSMELTYRGTDNFEVFATVRPEPGGRIVELSHRERRGAEAMTTYSVRAVATVQPFGGVRWWFICPATNRRVTKLWLPLGGSRFASRQLTGSATACSA
jgi:hypothetical protein